jgi:hypothetical protein
VVMADTWCGKRTAALPLRGYRMVGRVLMNHLTQFWVPATDVGWRSPWCEG